jgi:hypothetical protein
LLTKSTTLFAVGALASAGVALQAAELPTASPESVGMSSDRLERLKAAIHTDVDAGRAGRCHAHRAEATA